MAFWPARVVEAREYSTAQSFVAARLGRAHPALALDVMDDGIAIRRLRLASQPERHILAATHPASGTGRSIPADSLAGP